MNWERPRDGIAYSISSTLSAMGYPVVDFWFDALLPTGLDAVLSYGPIGSFVPVTNQILRDPGRRPLLVWWVTEQLPNPRLPESARYPLGVFRSYLERLAFGEDGHGTWALRPWLSWMTRKGHRFRYYGDLCWLQRSGLLSVLAMPSPWTAAFLRARGFDPVVTYFGSHPEWGRPLNLERDIPVLWLGKVATRRRARLLHRVREDLRKRSVEMLVVDGVEHPYVHGQERTDLLNRTRIALNLLREDWDDNSLRYYLAAANGALIVTEPTLEHSPFQPGVHLVESTVEQMAETICCFLSHEQERASIAARAHDLVTNQLTMKNALAPILERIRLLKGQPD